MATIAIVDDEKEILSMLERYLTRQEGMTIRTYTNPVSALSAIGNDVDLALLDIMMPQMDGLELLEKLREKHPDIKVVMMTAYSTLDRVLKAHRRGATHYVMKPFDSLEKLKQKLDEVLDS
jgi:DNA-binding NtrC family response regulator